MLTIIINIPDPENVGSYRRIRMGFWDILQIVCLVISLVACMVSFVTPHWLTYKDKDSGLVYHCGLWTQCGGDQCDWFLEEGFGLQNHLPDWFKACQALMAVGLAAGLTALLVATLGLCCECHSCNANHPVCGLLIIAFLTMGVAITIFGIKASDDWNIKFQWSFTSYGRFGWSFWVAIAAAVSSLVTACFYGCMGRKYRA